MVTESGQKARFKLKRECHMLRKPVKEKIKISWTNVGESQPN